MLRQSTLNPVKDLEFLDLDTLYDINKNDELMVTFGKQIDHHSLMLCKNQLAKVHLKGKSLRRINQSFFLSMDLPSN